MTKVLVQLNNLALGGTQINAVDMAWALTARGYDSVLAGPVDTLPRNGPSLFDIAAERGVPLETFERPRSTRAGAAAMSRLAERHGADIVHIYGSWTARAALWGPCLLGRRPLALTIYEMAVDPGTPRSPALVVGTRYLAEDLAGRAEGVELISPPVDLDRDAPSGTAGRAFAQHHGLEQGRLKIVTVTRLDESMKSLSVNLAIDAMDRMGDVGADLVIVGTGDAEAGIRARAAQVNARHGRPLVVLTGPMSDPRGAYDAADVVVGMGGSAARGLAFAKPLVVTGEFGWFKTFTPATSDGLFRNSFWSDEARTDAVEQLIECLRPLLADAGLRESLGAFSRDFATASFGLQAMADRQAAVYERLLRHYGPRAWSRELPLEAANVVRGARDRLVRMRSRTTGHGRRVATMGGGN
ncbi:glycosyltransferase involved in cell wall biosynthesis [Arthrobacter stackebrandtii]|uniref:Glycosyltransferase involved in cell wall biosynthesis n=1 Tax=Arthrobacter stackebrandtii TaxID=272161 RepID=A0ABS4YSH1_9MICC|nr:glycosyltransferase family 4 protein [Arthrobacter stackebrandtii]MBP2411555.1 glycosyltransferase involved in cell wall biosynthesis [Arthrobacter stackebrandtii]PYG99235.1 hypothetical protein CVV67_16040 [Arthrobacter stackebrandtii]